MSNHKFLGYFEERDGRLHELDKISLANPSIKPKLLFVVDKRRVYHVLFDEIGPSCVEITFVSSFFGDWAYRIDKRSLLPKSLAPRIDEINKRFVATFNEVDNG
jgi:hypothetical protein